MKPTTSNGMSFFYVHEPTFTTSVHRWVFEPLELYFLAKHLHNVCSGPQASFAPLYQYLYHNFYALLLTKSYGGLLQNIICVSWEDDCFSWNCTDDAETVQ